MRIVQKAIVLFVLIALVLAGFYAVKMQQTNTALQEKIDAMAKTIATMQEQLPSAAHIASQMTVICHSYMTYAQQTALEKGTGLEGVDFLYVEKATGIDAVFLMAIAWHESSVGGNPGTNYWAKEYNNVMSLGVTAVDPDRTYYATKTLNVYKTAQWLLRGYLHEGAPYYHGGLTQYEIGLSYASDGSWASGVTNAIATIESKLLEVQRMKRWCTKTTLFTQDVVWDYEHLIVGWALYKVELNKTVTGR